MFIQYLEVWLQVLDVYFLELGLVLSLCRCCQAVEHKDLEEIEENKMAKVKMVCEDYGQCDFVIIILALFQDESPFVSHSSTEGIEMLYV